MSNLFIVHTQYSLILSSGLSNGRFAFSMNDLILFQDFSITPELEDKLVSIFNRTLFLKGIFPITNQSNISKIQTYYSSIKKCNSFIIEKYDKIFIVLDMNLPEMLIMKRAYYLYPSVEFIALEDGSYPYFLNHTIAGGLDTNSFTRCLRKILFKYMLGCGKFYSFEGRFMGANTWLKSIYLTYKDHARYIYRSKNRIEITTEEFKTGIGLLYSGTKSDLRNNAALLILDKLDVYKNLQTIRKVIAELISILKESGKTIYYKYHPREDQSLAELKTCNELDRKIAIESYYKDFLHNKPLVIGIKSTGLQTAKKIGLKVVSIAKLADEENEDVLSFYNEIGIFILNDIFEINQILS